MSARKLASPASRDRLFRKAVQQGRGKHGD